MKTMLVTGLALVVSSYFLIATVPAADDAIVPASLASIAESQQEQSCPPADWISETYTGGACTIGSYFIGRDALVKNYLAEASVKPKDGNELFPTTWEVKRSGELLPAGVIQCGLSSKSHNKTLLEIPAERHRAAQFTTVEHHYMWFFASDPVGGCLGYGECVCY